MDKVGANFFKCMQEVQSKLGAIVLPLQLPVGVEAGFEGVVDLVFKHTILWPQEEEKGINNGNKANSPAVNSRERTGKFVISKEIPLHMQQEVEKWRSELIAFAAEATEELTEKYIDKGTLNTHEIIQGLRKQTLYNKFSPLLCGSSLKNKGVQPLLDAIVLYLPSPLDRPPVQAFEKLKRTKNSSSSSSSSSNSSSSSRAKNSSSSSNNGSSKNEDPSSSTESSSDSADSSPDNSNSNSNSSSNSSSSSSSVSAEKVIYLDHSPTGPLAALAFKISSDEYQGCQTFVRVYSGVLKKGEWVINGRTGERERMQRLLLIHSNLRRDVDTLYPGEIGAVLGPKGLTTGDTITRVDRPLVLERIDQPTPALSIALEARDKQNQEKMMRALQRMCREDPSLQLSVHPETQQLLLSGMGELHLDIIIDRLQREERIQVKAGDPQVAYRETIAAAAAAKGRYVKQSGGRGQYGEVVLQLLPAAAGTGVVFKDCSKGGVVPQQFIAAVEEGARQQLQQGPLVGAPMTDITVTLVDGSHHPVDSSEIAFQLAAAAAIRAAAAAAKPLLLEPLMLLQLRVPTEFVGDVIAFISSSRGTIQSMEEPPAAAAAATPAAQAAPAATAAAAAAAAAPSPAAAAATAAAVKHITAHVPLAELTGYATKLRSITQGRAAANLRFIKYVAAPPQVQQNIINKKLGNDSSSKNIPAK
ncbi:elongation factor G, putative [Eimeria brunetti]|uniref:Elongation factor G, putative n=1 Tax=Eimeria brunetti TaxID=51314 RepID=U6LPT0_9EIME|nr:elongation factor G, putative [Eimeria brunetti]